MVFLILGLPTFFIMTQLGGKTTGAIVNEPGQMRAERAQYAINFPVTTISPVHRMQTYKVRKALRDGAYEGFYEPYGISRHGHAFFDNELFLYGELLKLACLRPVTDFTSKGKFITPGGLGITIPERGIMSAQIQDIGQVPCNPLLREQAELTLLNILNLDLRLTIYTVQSSPCPDKSLADQSIELAGINIEEGNLEAAITNMRHAWSIATNCMAGR